MSPSSPVALGRYWPGRTLLTHVSSPREIPLESLCAHLPRLDSTIPPDRGAGILLKHPLVGRDPDIRERTDRGYEKLTRLSEAVRTSPKTQGTWLELAVDLLCETLYWDRRLSLDRYSIDVPLEEGTVRMSVVAKGDPHRASRVYFLIPGFGVDNRGFEPTFREFQPTGEEAMVSSALIGAGTLFPDEVDPTPAVLTQLYASALEYFSPVALRSGEVTVVGNSMGGMIGLGTTLTLASKSERPPPLNFLADNSMSWDVLEEVQPGLYRLLALTHPLGFHALHWGMKFLFSFDAILNKLVDALYTSQTIPPRPEDSLYTRHLFRNHPPCSGYLDTVSLLAKTGATIDGWEGFLQAQFPQMVSRHPLDARRIVGIHLPRTPVVVQSTGDILFDKRVSQGLAALLTGPGGIHASYMVRPGPHVETSPRILEALKESGLLG